MPTPEIETSFETPVRLTHPKRDDHKNVEKKWYIVDAADKRLGRLASTIAIHIRGKDVPAFTPSIDMWHE